MPTFKTLVVEDKGAVRVVTIHRPDVLNALDADVVAELTGAFEAAAEAPTVRGIVITGTGKAFVAGADIAAMAEMSPADALRFAGQGHAIGEMIASLPKPVIAAVNGFALGGGCEVALACDFIYASPKAKFGQPEVKLGVIPGFGGTQRLLRRVGLARAIELCLTGDLIDATEALRIGLCNRIVEAETLVATAVETVEKIAAVGPLAVAAAKDVLHRGADLPLGEANTLEQQRFSELFATADQREGMAAFLAKRPPQFTGR